MVSPMKLMPDKSISNPDFSALSAAELLGIVHNFQHQLSEKSTALQQRDNQIEQQKNYIVLLEELIKLSKLQKFAASSEKRAHQIHLFDEAEMQSQIDELRDQLPDSVKQESAPERVNLICTFAK